MKKILQWLAVCVFAVLVFVPALAQAQTVPTTITSFKVTDKNKQDLTSAFTNQDIYLTASWQAQGEVHDGDTFSLGIPDILDFPATTALFGACAGGFLVYVGLELGKDKR